MIKPITARQRRNQVTKLAGLTTADPLVADVNARLSISELPLITDVELSSKLPAHYRVFHTFPVEGKAVTYTAAGFSYASQHDGIYDGVRFSEWDGVLYHYFRDAVTGALSGFPVSQGVIPLPTLPEGIDPQLVVRAAARVKGEVVEDVKNGTVDPLVTDFASLHSYVDANMYGGEDADALWDEFMDHGDAAARGIDPYRGLNAMQDIVDMWIKTGGLREATAGVDTQWTHQH